MKIEEIEEICLGLNKDFNKLDEKFNLLESQNKELDSYIKDFQEKIITSQETDNKIATKCDSLEIQLNKTNDTVDLYIKKSDSDMKMLKQQINEELRHTINSDVQNQLQTLETRVNTTLTTASKENSQINSDVQNLRNKIEELEQKMSKDNGTVLENINVLERNINDEVKSKIYKNQQNVNNVIQKIKDMRNEFKEARKNFSLPKGYEKKHSPFTNREIEEIISFTYKQNIVQFPSFK